MNASIIYNSHSGTTLAYAEEIGNFLSDNGIDCKISSIDDYDKEYLLSSDLVLLGCWTNGLMIFAQHPDRAWKKFVEEMPAIREKNKPSLKMLIPFNIFKYVSKLDKELMKADYEYYKDKGDYYYETKIPFYKRIIAKKLTEKIINQFD